MSDIISDITLLVSVDNKVYVFPTMYLTESPLSGFIPYYIDFTVMYDVNIIKLSLLSSIIHAYLLLATGRRVYHLLYDYSIECNNDNLFNEN